MRIPGRYVRPVLAVVVGLLAACGFVATGPQARPLHHVETTVGASARHVAADFRQFGHHAAARARVRMPANMAEWATSPTALALSLGALALISLLVLRRGRAAPARATIRAPPVPHR
jgi:hypothetical protein